jgi:hypothetical protein
MAVVLLGVLRVSVRRARRLHSDQRYIPSYERTFKVLKLLALAAAVRAPVL